jgi:hypothetical protein
MLKKIELLANISIVIIALLLGTVLVKRYMSEAVQPAAAVPSAKKIQPGTKLQLPDIDWGRSEETLVLVLSDSCHFCTESAGFYRRLAQEKAESGHPRLIALLPQDVSRGQAYLRKIGVAVDEVRQSALSAVGVSGTPTLIVVDGAGVVKDSWVGKLPPDGETEVLNRLRLVRAVR